MSNRANRQDQHQQARVAYGKLAPKPFEQMEGLESYLDNCGLELSLRELVKTRVSQMNGCAYCVDMHTKDARAMGETEQRLYGLSAWRETPFYTARERAALAWAEAVTNIAQGHAPDAVWDEVCRHFGEQEAADLTWAIVAINSWNRLAIALRKPVGDYRSPYEKLEAVPA